MSLQSSLKKWVRQEKKRIKKSAGDASLVKGGDESVIARASASEPTTLFESIKDDITKGMANTDGLGALSINADFQKQQAEKAASIVEEMGDVADSIEGVLQNSPDPIEGHAALDRAMESIKNRLQQPEGSVELRESIDRIASSYQISDEEIENLQLGASTSTKGSGQSVKEVRSRFYNVSTQKAGRGESLDFHGDFDEVASTYDITVEEEGGVVRVSPQSGPGALPQDEDLEVQITPEAPRYGASEFSFPMSSVEDRKIEIEEEFAYPVYVCALLSLAKEVQDLYEDFSEAVKDAIEAHNVIGKIVKNKPADKLLNQWQSNLTEAGANLANQGLDWAGITGNPITSDGQTIGVSLDLSAKDVPTPNSSVCSQRHSTACASRKRVKRLFRDIDRAISAIPRAPQVSKHVNLEQHLKEANKEYRKLIKHMNDLDQKVEDLESSLCAWAQQNRKGIPEKLNVFKTALTVTSGVLVGLATNLTKWGQKLTSDKGIEEGARRLRKLGLSEAADRLSKGDFKGLYEMVDPASGTASGKASEQLDKRAEESASRRVRSEYESMSNAARARSEQVVTEMALRDSMRVRMRANNNVETAKTIQRASKQLDKSEARVPRQKETNHPSPSTTPPNTQDLPPVKKFKNADVLSALPGSWRDASINDYSLERTNNQWGLFTVNISYQDRNGRDFEGIRWVEVERGGGRTRVFKSEDIDMGRYNEGS